MIDDDPLDQDAAEDQPVSRSELKRQAQDRQALIARVLELAPSEWQRLGFGEAERRALAEGRKIKPSGARNRQIKYLAKLLDDEPLMAAAAFLDDRRTQQLEQNRVFHALERWRERLVEEGDGAMGELLESYPNLDRQQLRTLIRGAQRERDTGKPVGAGKKLFRYLRETAGV